jgi:hypothetical protein
MDDLPDVGIFQPSMRYSLKALWSTFGKILKMPRASADLAAVLFQNGSQPLKLEGPDDATDWVASFSGLNTRWETIGMLFVSFCYSLLSFPEKEAFAIFGERARDTQALIAEMKGCVEACIELCRSSLNILVCNLLYENMLLETVTHGDASKF